MKRKLKLLTLAITTGMLIIILSSCIRGVRVNPPGFFEMIAQFDEICVRQSRFEVFDPWNSLWVYLQVRPDVTDTTFVLDVREAITYYLLSDGVLDFFTRFHIDPTRAYVSLQFWRDLDTTPFIPSFLARVEDGFEEWRIEPALLMRAIRDYLEGFNTETIQLRQDSSPRGTDGFTTKIYRLDIFTQLITNEENPIPFDEFKEKTLAVFDELIIGIPDIIDRYKARFLNSYGWFSLEPGFTVLIQLIVNPRPYARELFSTPTPYHSFTFVWTEDEVWQLQEEE
ncbi:MAG: hypothetical protein FWC16_06440 [Defluviitaleaceae bacterium]|nr:hypothetical protein [Defluviitaleaceae bacterium]MCL2274548.1 hypothetical protein [Defluviitaleaceae bacterium]